MRFTRVMSGLILFVLEGPKRPWWLGVVLMATGPMVILAGFPKVVGVPVWIGCGMFAVGLWWYFIRGVQIEYVKGLKRRTTFDRCPACDYDLTAIASSVCPECGTSAEEYLRRVREATNSLAPPGQNGRES